MNILTDSYETISYGYIVPCYNGEIAWLIRTYEDVYIHISKSGHWYKEYSKTLHNYLLEIKSGKGNWIIGPQYDNSDLKWSQLNYKEAKVIKKINKVTTTSIGEFNND